MKIPKQVQHQRLLLNTRCGQFIVLSNIHRLTGDIVHNPFAIQNLLGKHMIGFDTTYGVGGYKEMVRTVKLCKNENT